MTDPLYDTAPDFDQPIAVLKHCHDRIRKQLGTLERLAKYLPDSGATVEARQAASAVMRYFDYAGVNHHQDEEQDLLPMLEKTVSGDDAALLQKLVPELLREHRQMDALWEALHPHLQKIASGTGTELPAESVKLFTDMYTAHMQKEETHVAPMAKRVFSDAQMLRLGQAMRARRNIA